MMKILKNQIMKKLLKNTSYQKRVDCSYKIKWKKYISEEKIKLNNFTNKVKKKKKALSI